MLHKHYKMKVINSTPISAFGGMNFVFDYLDKKEIGDLFNRFLPELKNQSKYDWRDLFYSLYSIYFCGGDCIEDLQMHLKPHFQNNRLINFPSPDTVLRRLTQLSQESSTSRTKRGEVDHQYNRNSILENLNVSLLSKTGVFSARELIMDYDNTIIFNEKSDSKMTYKRNPGYQPGVCTINEDQVLYIENRNGNSDAKSFQEDTLARVFNLLDQHKVRKIDHFRADAASYQYEVIKLLNEKVKYFYIGCRNSYVEKYFTSISQWDSLEDTQEGLMEVGEINITPFKQQIKGGKKAFKEYRLIVKRKPRKNGQLDIITQDAYEYRAILTNNFKLATKQVAQFYNHRGNMEKQFDILKNDFGWNQMPFSSLDKNTVFLYLTAICRNLYKKIISHFSKRVKTLKPTYRIKKFLFRFIILPARWIKQARVNKLRVYGEIGFST